MLERMQVRMLPVVNRATDLAPVAPACCNVCRTCTTTNIVGLVFGGVAAVGFAVTSFARRLVTRA
jgi:hypothetical protein